MMREARTLPINDVRLFVQESGAGPALLCLHGWTLDHRMWKYQIDALAAHYHVFAPDRRGCGRSSGTPDLARELEDIVALMAARELPRIVLYAASQAGRVALRFALAYPEKLSALVLQGTALDGMPELPADPGYVPLMEYAELAQAGGMDEVRRRWLGHPLMQLPPGRDDLRTDVMEMVGDCKFLDLRRPASTPTGGSLNLVGTLGAISTLTLILSGAEETPHRKAIARTLLREIPGARAVEIPGGGHLINMIAPEACNRAVLQFLADVAIC